MWAFFLGTGILLFGSVWTTYTGELATSLIWAIWGGALIIKDAIDEKDVA